jgi:hypothetical protein
VRPPIDKGTKKSLRFGQRERVGQGVERCLFIALGLMEQGLYEQQLHKTPPVVEREIKIVQPREQNTGSHQALRYTTADPTPQRNCVFIPLHEFPLIGQILGLNIY